MPTSDGGSTIVVPVEGFDWDDGNRAKCRIHGVSLAEAEEVFRDPEVRISPDAKHSDHETRFLAIGRTTIGRHVFVAFTVRKSGDCAMIRPISVRYMHLREVSRYAEETS